MTAYWCPRQDHENPDTEWTPGEDNRGRRAYVHPNKGAAVIWCPEHGILVTTSLGIEDPDHEHYTGPHERFIPEDVYEAWTNAYAKGQDPEPALADHEHWKDGHPGIPPEEIG